MGDSARRRVLIVDDEIAIVDVLSEHLQADYDIEAALNGTDALGAVLRQRPDVVLLDINMPGMAGVEVLKNIKQMDESIAVVMVTADVQVALAAETLKGGAFGYVPKPFDFRYIDHLHAVIVDSQRTRRR